MSSIKRFGALAVAAVAATALVAPPAGATGSATEATTAGNPVNIAAKTLTGYKHVDQKTDYWCGPATAYILISGMKAHGRIKTTKSKAHPKWAFSQHNLAKSTYLEANGSGGTQRADMAAGLNKWIGRKEFTVLSNPSPKQFRAALTGNLNRGYGVAVAAYEPAGGKYRYNGHPKGDAVDHWIVARGHSTDIVNTHFVDPATRLWKKTEPYFSYNTTLFVNRFVKSKAIVW